MIRLNQQHWFIAITVILGLSLPFALQAEELPKPLWKEITRSCIANMANNIVSQPVAQAYCYCYAHNLGELLTVQDFERIGERGVSQRDQQLFDRARQTCKPKKEKK